MMSLLALSNVKHLLKENYVMNSSDRVVYCTICGLKSIFSHSYILKSQVFHGKPIYACCSCELMWGENILQKDLDNYYLKEYNQSNFQRSKIYPPINIFQIVITSSSLIDLQAIFQLPKNL